MKKALLISMLVLIAGLVTATLIVTCLSAEDAKLLVDDEGPIQAAGFYMLSTAVLFCLVYAFNDRVRFKSWLSMSLILSIYAAREADVHRMVSPHARITQFKRFFLQEEIPLSTKFLTYSILLTFIVVFLRFLYKNRQNFLTALKENMAMNKPQVTQSNY